LVRISAFGDRPFLRKSQIILMQVYVSPSVEIGYSVFGSHDDSFLTKFNSGKKGLEARRVLILWVKSV